MMYQNDQLWKECLLVSVWNAGRFYGLRVPEFKSAEYKRICKKYHCINDGCDLKYMKKEANRLGMQLVDGDWNLSWIRNNLPVEVGIATKKMYHSVLIVEVYGYKLKLANYTKNRCYWMLWSKLKKKAWDESSEDFFDDPISFKLGL